MRTIIRRIRRRLSPSRKVVTLEINSTSLRIMETRGIRVTKWASQPLGPGIFENDVAANPRGLSIAIRNLLASNGLKVRKISVSVSGLFSLSRNVVVPASAKGGTVAQEVVLEKAKEMLPISDDELYLSWQNIAAVAEGQRVFVVGAPRNMVDGEVRALRAAGINPLTLELKATALMRVVNRKQALILNVEPTTIDIILVVDGMVQSAHTTAWQPANLSVDDRAERLTIALGLVVGAYNSNHPVASLAPDTPFFITGGMSGDIELIEAVYGRVAYPEEPLFPPLEYPPHFPVSQYAVNIGLTLRSTAVGGRNHAFSEHLPLAMNLLPQSYRSWRPSRRQVYAFFAIAAVIALLLPTYDLITNVIAKTASLKTRYDLGKLEVDRRRAELSRREPLQKYLGTYQTIVGMGGGFIEDMKVITDKAVEFGIEVPAITDSGDSITITAVADNFTAFRDYLASLQANGRFASVTGPPENFPYIREGTIRLIPRKQ